MGNRLFILLGTLLLGLPAARAQWVVSDPSNLAQGIVNSINEMVHTSETAAHMLDNFKETVKIYEQARDYYDKLRSVTGLVRNARKVQECMLITGDISQIYVDAYERIVSDEHFSVQELAAIAQGFSGLITRSTEELAELQTLIRPTELSMTDAERLELIEGVHGRLSRLRELTRYFARKNIGVSVLRARRAQNLERTAGLYADQEQRYR